MIFITYVFNYLTDPDFEKTQKMGDSARCKIVSSWQVSNESLLFAENTDSHLEKLNGSGSVRLRQPSMDGSRAESMG